MSDDKVREIVDKVKRGEIPLDSAESGTEETDEGGIRKTVGGLCGPCSIDNHSECKGALVCSCAHPSHEQQPQPGGQAH